MASRYFYKKHVRDCLICAIRPLIYAGFTITYIGRAKCPHNNNTDKPKIKENTISTVIARICNLFLVTDVVYVVFKILRSEPLIISPKYYYNIILPNYINTLNYTFCFLRHNGSYISYTNRLVSLVNRRKFFGIKSILTKKFTGVLQLWSLFCFCFIIAVCLLFLCTTTPNELSLESFLLAVSMLINNINAIAFSAYSITILVVYRSLLQACFKHMHETFEQALVNARLLSRLQFQQQFYLSVCYNYKKHTFGFGNVFFYAGQIVFTIFSVVQAYFFTFEPMDNEGYWFILFSRFFHILLGLVSSAVCFLTNSIQLMSQDLISFLNKYKINKLNAAEASQVEVLLIMLYTEKPILTASDLYTIGINLLASVSGTAITYVLVALQFHASFSTT